MTTNRFPISDAHRCSERSDGLSRLASQRWRSGRPSGGTADHETRSAVTAADDAPFSLLAWISTEMVQAMKQHFGKGPVSAKSYLLDDLLFVVLREGMTRAERTMLTAGREDHVRGFRQEFENEMTGPMIGIIERLTRRRVINYQSQVLFDPDMSIKIFVFADQGTGHTTGSLIALADRATGRPDTGDSRPRSNGPTPPDYDLRQGA